jgi:putative transposase
LQAAGWRVGENTVARRMAALGLAGRPPKRRRSLTRQGKRAAAPDRVRRQFTAPAPDVLWCGDMTEIVTDQGKLYLATVIDLFSRRLLGYAMSARHDAELVEASLNMAAATRGGTVDGVIFHSDRGSEGVSLAFTDALREADITASIGSVGDALDNALMESTIGLFKTEVIEHERPTWTSWRQVEQATASWVHWYNHDRLHSSIGHVPPAEYETTHYASTRDHNRAAAA